MQLVFQDPYASLNPRMTVLELVAEPLVVHGVAKYAEAARATRSSPCSSGAGCPPTPSTATRTPSAAVNASASASPARWRCDPNFIVADEPVSALDVSVRAQVVNLLQDLQHELGLTYLFIAHDLSVVRHISHRIAILYAGKLVELAATDDIYERTTAPLHRGPALERADPRSAGASASGGASCSPARSPTRSIPPAGCRFQTRCPLVEPRCRRRVAAARGEGTRPLGRVLRPLTDRSERRCPR